MAILKAELDIQLRKIEEQAVTLKNKAIKAYCDSKNPYKTGDVFEDHIGKIIVERIEYHKGYSDYFCIYYGTEVKKDGTAKKKSSRRWAYQNNDIKNK
ncbi:MAG: hypothetical protein RBS96_02200 [Dehalococcoidales bacterium]|jgi:hypothetical protein|nr:hypothetical protein [Dehalococcoidales bacterium]